MEEYPEATVPTGRLSKLHRSLLIRLKRYRRLLLSDLEEFGRRTGPNAFLKLDPQDILKRPGDAKYVNTIRVLVAQRLILQVGTPESGPAFRINPERHDDVRRELAWWRDPFLHFMVGGLLALGALITAVATLV